MTTKNGSDPLLSLKEDFERCKRQDADRNTLIEKLFQRNKELLDTLEETQSNLKKEKDLCGLYYKRAEDYEGKLSASEQRDSRNPFVLVLIDGDCMPFNDGLIKQGKEGGLQAAAMLRGHIQKHVKAKLAGISSSFRLIVRVYANARGLGRVYKDHGIIQDFASFEGFVRGFNMEDPLCDFVDSGEGKECADEKVRESFKIFSDNVHCQHILFGGSADNGYARLLGPYSRDTEASTRITMLEGPPFAKEMADLVAKFQTVALDGVFRQTKLVSGKVPQAPSYSKAVKKANSQELTASVVPAASGAGGKPSGLWWQMPIQRNASGQRIDPPLETTPQANAFVKAKRLCKPFHLLGQCDYGKGCCYVHCPGLSQAEHGALRLFAREAPCNTGASCVDPKCCYGHRCPKENCTSSKCRFPAEMHGPSTTAANS